MKKIGNFIVKGRYWFLGIFFVLLVASAVLMNFVHINYDLTEYLPDSSNTKQSIELMKQEFGSTGTASIMLTEVTEKEADDISKEIQDIKVLINGEATKTVQTCVVSRFKLKEGSETKGYAMLNIFLTNGDYTQEAEKTLDAIKTLMNEKFSETDQNYYLLGSSVTAVSSRSAITKEIPIIMIIAVLIVLVVLAFTTRSWIEPLMILIVIGFAILINMGTNYFLGSISFISNSVASVLLIALAMDYSIVLVNRFREEREKTEDVFEAMKKALNGSLVTIIASGCTVMAGLISLMFMNYKIGFDMGLVLTKGVFLSLLAVIFLMPGILLLFSKLLKKTEHKNFLSKVSGIGTFSKKTRFVIPVLFLVIVCGAFAVQNTMLSFDYNAKFSKDGNSVYEAEQKSKEIFGEQNSLVVILKAKDGEEIILDDQSQIDLLNSIKDLEINVGEQQVKLINASSSFLTSGANVSLEQLGKTGSIFITLGTNMDLEYLQTNFNTTDLLKSLGITDEATLNYAKQIDAQVFSAIITNVGEKYGYSKANTVTVYNTLKYLNNETDKNVLLGQVQQITSTIPDAQLQLILALTYNQMVNFAAEKGPKEELAETIYFSKEQNYVRIIFNIEAEISSSEAKTYLKTLNTFLQSENLNFSLVNNTQNVLETENVFVQDRLRVELISALAILLICLLSFRSISLPVILVLIIEGAIWINLAGNALLGNSIFFICYLLGTAIQMGATIDYGILLCDRFKEARRTQDKFTAIKTAIDKSFATIISSGSILTLAAFTIGLISSVPLISSIGYLIGFGALCASLTILFILPGCLLLLDKFIAKTTLKSNFLFEPKTAKITEATKVVKTKVVEQIKAEKVDNGNKIKNTKGQKSSKTTNSKSKKNIENKKTTEKNSNAKTKNNTTNKNNAKTKNDITTKNNSKNVKKITQRKNKKKS